VGADAAPSGAVGTPRHDESIVIVDSGGKSERATRVAAGYSPLHSCVSKLCNTTGLLSSEINSSPPQSGDGKTQSPAQTSGLSDQDIAAIARSVRQMSLTVRSCIMQLYRS
jgi:hypothetical protein